MKYIKELALGLGCLLLSFFFFMADIRTAREALAAEIAPDILRFHVLANSDSKKDQELKLKVRDLVLNYMQELPDVSSGKEAYSNFLSGHLDEIESIADSYIADSGFTYQTKAELVNCHFPPRTYGNLTLPEGNYDALRIIIGQGNGRNWWCVLYPQLCFTDAVTTDITAESEQQLKAAVEKDGRLLVEDSRPQIRFLIQDLNYLLPPSHNLPSPGKNQASRSHSSSSLKDRQPSTAETEAN